MEIDLELLDANSTLYAGISSGDPVRVVADHATYEGTFKTLFVNQHDGLGINIEYTRAGSDGHDVLCTVSLPGASIRKLERLGGPTEDPSPGSDR